MVSVCEGVSWLRVEVGRVEGRVESMASERRERTGLRSA